MESLLAGKRALVVGGSSGIGRCIAQALAGAGAEVVVAARREAQCAEVVAAILASGGVARALVVDVTDTASVEHLLHAALPADTQLDIAVNNAGIEGTPMVPTADYDEAVFDRVIETNVKGVWRCMKSEIPHMGEGGVIVNMSSIAGLRANEFMGCAYAASKHAVVGMTKTAAREYAGLGIRINAICPGVITTAMAQRSFLDDPDLTRKVARMHPLGRLGTPEEVADAVLWMVSERASFMTGHALVLDGGVSC